MKLWLDDVRRAPEGWTHARTADEAIELLQTTPEQIEAISLDHDLGALPSDGIYARGMSERCGCLVVDFIVASQPRVATPIRVHSWNSQEASRMALKLNDAGYDVVVKPFDILRDR